jgi:hypothetical protein
MHFFAVFLYKPLVYAKLYIPPAAELMNHFSLQKECSSRRRRQYPE